MEHSTFFYHQHPKQRIAKRTSFKKMMLLFASLLFFASIAFVVAKVATKETIEKSTISSDELIKRVALHTTLPRATPTIATVTDPSQLIGQSFFQHAATGDKVLIYTESKQAILYRPLTDKIIEIAPISDY